MSCHVVSVRASRRNNLDKSRWVVRGKRLQRFFSGCFGFTVYMRVIIVVGSQQLGSVEVIAASGSPLDSL
eukprot:4199451-Amphidinium_carterae.1